MVLCQVLPGLFGIIFGKLYRLSDRRIASGDEAHYHVERYPIGRWTLRRIHDPEPSTGTGTNVKQAAALFHADNDLSLIHI